jgi:hypothetical protein
MDMAFVGGMLFGAVIAVVIGLLVAGLVLKFSVRLVAGFSPGYWRAVLVVLLAGIVGFIVNIVAMSLLGVGSSMAAMGPNPDPSVVMAAMGGAWLGAMAISMIAGLLLYGFFINWLLKQPDGGSIGFGRSVLAALLYLVAMFVLAFIFTFVIGIVAGLGAASMAGAAG